MSSRRKDIYYYYYVVQVGTQYNVFRMVSGPTVRLTLFGVERETSFSLKRLRWYHVAWTWSSTGQCLFDNMSGGK